MEQETKTITMPLSEYRRMEEIVANYRDCKDKLRKEFDDMYKEAIKQLNEGYNNYYDKCVLYGKRIKELEEELQKYKRRKWYQF